jgi:glycosyltransferase involved in cell wall biosynthesis
MTDRLNILFLSSWYPNRVTTTKGNFVQRHAEAVATRCNVVMVNVIEDPKLTTEKFEMVRSAINGVDTLQVYTKPGISKLSKWSRFFKGYDHAMAQVLKEFKPDVIHGNVFFPVGIVAKKWSLRLKIPMVFTEHLTSYLPANRHTLKSKHLRSIKTSAALTSKILPVSHDLKKAMQELNIGSEYEVVPNVVDTSLFKPNFDERKLKRIIHVSTAKDFHKNVSGILRTITELKKQRSDFDLLIISDGDLAPHRKLANDLEIDDVVTFEEEQPIEEIGVKMGKSDLFLLFSNFENLPCVIIEALSAGLPVVSTNVGGIPEMLDDSNGKMVNPKDEKALLESIIEVLDSESYDAKEISIQAQRKYSIEAVSSQLLKIYKEVIPSSR